MRILIFGLKEKSRNIERICVAEKISLPLIISWFFFTHQIFIEPKFCFFMLKKTIPIILSLNLTAQNGNVLFSHTRFCMDPQNICNLRVLCKDSLISASILTNK